MDEVKKIEERKKGNFISLWIFLNMKFFIFKHVLYEDELCIDKARKMMEL